MKLLQSFLQEVQLIRSPYFQDDRGSFLKVFNQESELLNKFVVQQTNLVTTKENYTLRGLHYQQNDFAEAKFFRVVSGSIQLAFARVNRIPLLSDSVILSEPDVGVLVPRGFATGYLTLAENTSVLYLSDNVYRADYEAGIRWNDPSLSINWQSQSPILSEKDQKWPNF
jgi:dTDP-4-dehydrorhamnose 3,5-epimerase